MTHSLDDALVEKVANALWQSEGYPDDLSLASDTTQERLKHLARAALEAAGVAELREALSHARGAIASLDDDALGWSQPPHDEIEPWPLKAELLHMIGAALTNQGKAQG